MGIDSESGSQGFALKTAGAMKSFAPYVTSLHQLVSGHNDETLHRAIEPTLNGYPYQHLRNIIPVQDRRESGAFFTHHDLADYLVKPIRNRLQRGLVVLDPACGTGNLLVSCARHLPIEPGLSATISLWGRFLWGFDIHTEFVKATKIRLIMLALSRGVKNDKAIDDTEISKMFPKIMVQDGLAAIPKIEDVQVILLNPPYTRMRLSSGQFDWAAGSTSAAAVFIAQYLQCANSNTDVMAILPDVLRTGTLYAKWRRMVEQKVELKKLEIKGLFDTWTDIDVFTTWFTVKKENDQVIRKKITDWWQIGNAANGKKVQDLFEVRVGPVVPHRLKNEGRWAPFIHARTCPPFGSLNTDFHREKIRYNGPIIKPPFIVIRRTSGPKDNQRITATLIRGSVGVAVENHLIILQPKSRTLRECKWILPLLNTSSVNNWVNQRIRCRHLTVSVVSNLPLGNINGKC